MLGKFYHVAGLFSRFFLVGEYCCLGIPVLRFFCLLLD